MKIIKRGIPPAERIYRISCYHCGSELEFKDEDKKYDYRGDGAYIECPICHVYLSTATVRAV